MLYYCYIFLGKEVIKNEISTLMSVIRRMNEI